MEAAAATDQRAGVRDSGRSQGARSRPPAAGPDRASVILFSLATLLAVLALLAWQLRSGPSRSARRAEVVVRRVYETTVVETITGSGSASGTSVSQSVYSSGSGFSSTAAPTTRSSSH